MSTSSTSSSSSSTTSTNPASQVFTEPSPEKASQKPLKNGWKIYKRLASYAIEHWRYLILALIALIITALTQPLFAAYMKPLLDGTFMEKDPQVIRWAPVAILAIFLLRGVSGFLSSYAMTWVGRSVVTKLRTELFDRLLHLPLKFYDQNNSGQLVTRMIYQVEQVAVAATKGLTILVQDTVSVIGLLGWMFYLSWELTLIVLLSAPFIAAIISYVTKRFRRLSNQIQDSVGEVTQVTSEAINSIREIRIFNGMEYETKRFDEINQRNRKSMMKHVITDRLSMPIVHFIVAIALAIVIYVATQGSLLERFSPGAFMSFMTAMLILLDPIKRLTNVNATLQSGIAAGESIFNLLDAASETDAGTRKLDRARGAFEFNHIGFRYNEDGEEVLKDITFSVKPGEKIALVGHSGSGKTTLVNLLPRFYDYSSGEIRLDGYRLPELTLSSLRQQFAYVGQDVTLFNDTVRNNIAYGKMRDVSQAQLEAAAQAAYALDFINKLPQGFDTLIGENGALLSGGQKQRLAIARAILADAPILILDEATSALDTRSERHIQRALETLLENRTTFMIAHRLSTIEKADRILMMEAGRIIESGTHQALLEKNGAYAKLYHLQFEDI